MTTKNMQNHFKTIFKKLQQRSINIRYKYILKSNILTQAHVDLKMFLSMFIPGRKISVISGTKNNITLSCWDKVKFKVMALYIKLILQPIVLFLISVLFVLMFNLFFLKPIVTCSEPTEPDQSWYDKESVNFKYAKTGHYIQTNFDPDPVRYQESDFFPSVRQRDPYPIDSHPDNGNKFTGPEPKSESSESSKESSDSESDSDSDPVNNYSTQIILNNYKMYVADSTGDHEFIGRSLHFIATQFPEELLGKTEPEITDDQSVVNRFLTKLSDECPDNVSLRELISLKASITTYNYGAVLNVLDNEELLEKVYLHTIQMIIKKLQE